MVERIVHLGDRRCRANDVSDDAGAAQLALPAGCPAGAARLPQRVWGEGGAYALYGYEAMTVVLDAVRSSGARGNDRQTVIDRVFATKNRNSVLGRYSVEPNGETTLSQYGVDRVSHGRPVFLRAIDVGRRDRTPASRSAAAGRATGGSAPLRRPVRVRRRRASWPRAGTGRTWRSTALRAGPPLRRGRGAWGSRRSGSAGCLRRGSSWRRPCARRPRACSPGSARLGSDASPRASTNFVWPSEARPSAMSSTTGRPLTRAPTAASVPGI